MTLSYHILICLQLLLFHEVVAVVVVVQHRRVVYLHWTYRVHNTSMTATTAEYLHIAENMTLHVVDSQFGIIFLYMSVSPNAHDVQMGAINFILCRLKHWLLVEKYYLCARHRDTTFPRCIDPESVWSVKASRIADGGL